MAGDLDPTAMINAYNRFAGSVKQMMVSIGGQTAAGVQMQQLFQLQMSMNQLTMFGQSVTQVIQGVQEVAVASARNSKGA